MKKYIYVIATACAVTSGSMFLGSCSAEDDYYPEELVLDINDQIGRKRSMSGEGDGIFTDDPYASYGKIPVNEDECALFALTSIKEKDNEGWHSSGTNAEEYYYNLYDYASEKFGYEGGSMDASTMLEVGKHFDLITGIESFGSAQDAANYFTTNKGIKIINIEGHTAKFVSYDAKKQEVKYYDSEGPHTCPVGDVISVFYK